MKGNILPLYVISYFTLIDFGEMSIAPGIILCNVSITVLHKSAFKLLTSEFGYFINISSFTCSEILIDKFDLNKFTFSKEISLGNSSSFIKNCCRLIGIFCLLINNLF